METPASAPLLSRVKSWQLVGLGLSGWCTLYSVAILTWGSSSFLIGNAQGGCFAITMTLAGCEASRFRKKNTVSTDPLQWASGVPTEHLNQSIAQFMRKQSFRIEKCQAAETEMGFGVRAVNTGRTLVFETGRWREPVIDLRHAKSTEENRKTVRADLAFIVGTGTPDEDTQIFVKTHPVQLLLSDEIKEILNTETPVVETPVAENPVIEKA